MADNKEPTNLLLLFCIKFAPVFPHSAHTHAVIHATLIRACTASYWLTRLIGNAHNNNGPEWSRTIAVNNLNVVILQAISVCHNERLVSNTFKSHYIRYITLITIITILVMC